MTIKDEWLQMRFAEVLRESWVRQVAGYEAAFQAEEDARRKRKPRKRRVTRDK